MTQVKIFYTNDSGQLTGLEREINSWLQGHAHFKIERITATQAGDYGYQRTVYIWYTVPEENPYR